MLIDMTQQVLLVEDEQEIAYPLVRTLEREGYQVTWVQAGQAALERVRNAPPHLLILDLGLPDMDGLEVCRSVRDMGFEGGIMILTARGDELDRVVGLDYGADDYLAKPFGLAELQARVRALLRRAARTATPTVTTTDGLRVDSGSRRVFVDEVEVALTTKEFDVLELLSRTPGQVIARDELMAQVWDENWFGSTKTLDVTIGRLRQKLEDAGATARVVAVRGVGFRLEGGEAHA